jgi:hypothetical protein
MKRLLLFIGIIFCHASFGQQMLGISNSNFAGSAGMELNPASMMLMPYKWEATLMTLHVSLENNYLSYSADKIFNSERVQQDKHGGLIDDFSPGDKNANLHIMLKAPSFIYKTRTMAFGFHTSVRSDLSIRNVPSALAKSLYEGKDYTPLYGTSIDGGGIRGGALGWMEAGISFGKKIKKGDDGTLLAAGTAKIVAAYMGAYMHVEEGGMNIVNDSTMQMNNINGELKYAVPTNPSPMAVPGKGAGVDLGLCYVVVDPDAGSSTVNASPAKKYKYRLGVSLLDLGLVSFTRNAKTYSISNPTSMDSLIDESKAGNSFIMSLPTALSVQYDYCLLPKWFINVSAVQRVPVPMARVDRPNNVSATLRFETAWFEVAVPYSFYDYYQHRIGLGLRYHFFFIGTDKIGTFVNNDHITGLDFYFGIKLTNFDFKKKGKIRKGDCCPSF